MALGDDHLRGLSRTQITVCSFLLVVTWTLFSMRIYVRTFMSRTLGIDDAMLLVTVILFTGFTSLSAYSSSRFIQIRTLDTGKLYFSYLMTIEVTYVATQVFLKLSLGFLYMRLALERWHKAAIWSGMIFSTISGIAYILLCIFQCGSPGNMFVKLLLHKCLAKRTAVILLYAQAGTITLTDWMFAIFPISLLYKSGLNRRTKVSVCLILVLGASGCVFSVVRLLYVKGMVDWQNFQDTAVRLLLWSVCEQGTGIAAASLLTMRPIFVKFLEGSQDLPLSFRRRVTSATELIEDKVSTPRLSQPSTIGEDEKKVLTTTTTSTTTAADLTKLSSPPSLGNLKTQRPTSELGQVFWNDKAIQALGITKDEKEMV